MARDVDWLVAVTPGSAETRRLVNREVLEALGAEGIFVNVARGSVVDQDALVDCWHRAGSAARPSTFSKTHRR